EALGAVEFRAARLRSAEAVAGQHSLRVRFAPRGGDEERVECFDAIVNCTGLDAAAGVRANPLLASLVADGALSVDETGIGFAVDARCRAIGADGRPDARLRVIGPPAAGTSGDPLGAMFIAAQVYRMRPDVFDALGHRPETGRAEAGRRVPRLPRDTTGAKPRGTPARGSDAATPPSPRQRDTR